MLCKKVMKKVKMVKPSPVHRMEECMESTGIPPVILKLGTG
jgi:hypothetical protein